MRLFIAILFDKTTKQNIRVVQERLQKLGRGNFTQADNLHLTLAFLGEISQNRLSIIKHIIDEAAGASFSITFDHVGRFQREVGDIWWIGLQQNLTMEQIHYKLSSGLISNDFILENRKFSPHITLARKFITSKELDREYLMGQMFTTRAVAISLMQSQKIAGKLTYIELYKKELI